MEPNKREERRRIFRQELFTLKENGYLSEAIVETVVKAHHQYNLDLIGELELAKDSTKPNPPIQKTAPQKPQKIKKTLSPEEIRERNITWSLNIGVIFLLIGALFVATSNWESMTSLMKSGSIAIVALVFYGLAFLAKRILKIDKTAFAFIVLGSLFLPIFILSLGWFGLLGPYLSINGEGRYFLGMLGSFIPIVVYIYFATKLASRLFVWFTYVSLTAGVAFLLAGIHLKIDFFYLGMMVFNVMLILIYHRFKKWESYQLFTKEFVTYIQVNLVLCTLFMLFIYDNEVLYSFNLLLTAIIYLSMMYVSGRKEYHFIFTVMIVYGAYQLIEHSFLNYVGEMLYALIGFAILFVPRALDGKFTLDRVFQYTSAVISGFAFIYISLEGIMLRSGEPSVVLMLSYLIIAANFIYLSHKSPRKLFPYLSSVFLASGIYEAVALLLTPVNFIGLSLKVSITGFILLVLFGIALSFRCLKITQTPSRDVGLGIIGLGMLTAIALYQWWELGVILLLLMSSAYLLYKKETRKYVKESSLWILPGALGLSAVAFSEEFIVNSKFYSEEYGYAINFFIGAALVFLSRLVWAKAGEKEIERISLYTSPVLYTFAIYYACTSPINEFWVQPLVLLVGIAMYYHLYRKVGTDWVPFIIGIETLLSYFSVIHAIKIKFILSDVVNSLTFTTCAVILLLISILLRRKDQNLSNAFAWIGHCIYPLTLAFTWFAFHTNVMYSFIGAFLVYGLSTRLAQKEWKVKAFLYSCFSSLFFVISTGLEYFIPDYSRWYEFPITSGLILAFVLLSTEDYKKRTAFYFVPFSLLGIVCMIVTYPFNWSPYLVTCSYIIIVLCYMHKINWDVLGIIPLFLAFVGTVQFLFLSEMDDTIKILLLGGLGILMTVAGQTVYKKLFTSGTRFQEIKLDGYSIVSLLYFWCMYFFENEYLWSHVLPGILVAVTLWLQKKRVPADLAFVMPILAGIYTLQPYYSMIDELNIPSLWEREVQVLPLIILVIFIRKNLKGRFSDITKAIQWAVLIIVSLLLIQDGLASNTIYDAIILGSLSLLSMLAGMFLQIKSYFFVGSGVLLLNVFLQTRPYWGNMPWWVYLLITGLILISVASFNEWHKQKVQKGEPTFITFLKEKVIDKIKQWD